MFHDIKNSSIGDLESYEKSLESRTWGCNSDSEVVDLILSEVSKKPVWCSYSVGSSSKVKLMSPGDASAA